MERKIDMYRELHTKRRPIR